MSEKSEKNNTGFLTKMLWAIKKKKFGYFGIEAGAYFGSVYYCFCFFFFFVTYIGLVLLCNLQQKNVFSSLLKLQSYIKVPHLTKPKTTNSTIHMVVFGIDLFVLFSICV